ncbi:MAG: hypothetical protein E7413_02295 [Ruminococcaceae bacterium]|nr:hypothetical protein [Oscillospiraceae bacterium]
MKKDLFSRIAVILVIAVVFLLFIVFRLFSLQIINGEEYVQDSMKRMVKTMPLKAQRGEILDRYGRVLVSSQITYNVEITQYKKDTKWVNDTVYQLIRLMERENQEFVDNLPISELPYTYTMPADELKTFFSNLELPEDISAEKCMKELTKRYQLPSDIPAEYLRKMVAVRSEMEQREFSQNNPYIFAKNVNMNVVTIIKENDRSYPGANIVTSYDRLYPEAVAPHLLGRVGLIYKEEYDELKDLGYGFTDIIGKEGIEKVYDLELKGKDGIVKIEQNEYGKITQTDVLQNAVPGNDLILTIDLDLQKTAEEALENIIAELGNSISDIGGGAITVVDVHTGEVLAMASYPDYDLSNFQKDYAQNYSNPLKPFWNRAISGTYAPGSTFKILTSLAILEENIASPGEYVQDLGKYTYFKDYQPTCHVYPANHGYVNVSDAIKVSCNYYFYEMGRKLGIEKLNEYAKKVGLGEYTGIEIPGEEKGIVAGPEYRKKIDEPWYPGDVLQASIGQSDNLYTPLQLSNYIATVVNGGTRYETHLLYRIKDRATGEIKEIHPTALDTISIQPENYTAIMEGMRSVTEDGTASSTFTDFSIPVGGKTGTAEVPGTNNGLFVAFAPYDNPQIAISVVVEHGAHGNSIAPAAREVIAEYFQDGQEEVQEDYEKFQVK